MPARAIRACGRSWPRSAGEWQAVQILRADGTPGRRHPAAGAAQRRGGGRARTAGGRPAATAPAAASGYDQLSSTRRAGRRAVDEALRQALVNLDAVPAPAGEMEVVLGPGWPGILLHEAIGHGLEGDFNRKKTSAFSGLLGQRVAAPGVTVVDDGTLPDRRGSLTVDDEGTPTSRTVLIEDGVLVGYMQDRLNARLMGMAPTGNGRRAELRPRADAADDQHRHARRRARDPSEIIALGEARPLRRQLRRRPGGHHLRQVRVLGAPRPI